MCSEKNMEATKTTIVEGEASSSRFKSVCVFCGSSTGKRDSYREAAIELGQELV